MSDEPSWLRWEPPSRRRFGYSGRMIVASIAHDSAGTGWQWRLSMWKVTRTGRQMPALQAFRRAISSPSPMGTRALSTRGSACTFRVSSRIASVEGLRSSGSATHPFQSMLSMRMRPPRRTRLRQRS
jgi:hypothetical protein